MFININDIVKAAAGYVAVTSSLDKPSNNFNAPIDNESIKPLVSKLSSCNEQICNGDDLCSDSKTILDKFHRTNGARLVSYTPSPIYSENQPYKKEDGSIGFKPMPSEDIFKKKYAESKISSKDAVTAIDLIKHFGEDFIKELAPKFTNSDKEEKSQTNFSQKYLNEKSKNNSKSL